MHAKLVADARGKRTFVVVLDSGEDAFASLTEWAAEEIICGAALTAIGAFEPATVGWFDFDSLLR